MSKAIFITGGASGIGRATAQLFAAKGWFVGLADVNEVGLHETAALLPQGKSSVHILDVRNRAAWGEALENFVARSGNRLDVLFNNAGVARGGQFADCSTADHDLLIDVNLKGVIYGAEAALPHLQRTPGSVLINTASAAGIHGAPGLATYAASKFGVRGLTESLDVEWAPLGIRVHAIMPGFIDTPLLSVTTAGSNHSARDNVVESGLEFTPVEQVAEAVWEAATHGKSVHYPVGKTARRLRFMARWMPGLLRAGMKRKGISAAN